MTNFKYTLKFQIHYHTNFQQFAIISGNIAHLGRWNPAQGLKMNWNEVSEKNKLIIRLNIYQNKKNILFFLNISQMEG